MKKFALAIISILGCLLLGVAQSPSTNYVKTTVYRVQVQVDPSDQELKVLLDDDTFRPITPDDKVSSIQYFDGLGRPLQALQLNAGGNHQTIVQHFEFDQYGRQVKNYLPYPVAPGSNPLDMVDPSDPVTGFDHYYRTNYANDFDPNFSTINPYSETDFEDSPLNRVLRQAAPGSDWAMESGHEIKMEYRANSPADNVMMFGVSFPNLSTATPSDNLGKYEPKLEYEGYYPGGRLYKNIVRDENHVSGNDHTVEEFTDKQGRVVLKRTYEGGDPHDTYYVYDD
ncbi:MAG: DUF6443 domain-containing protein, partial [Nonlabens sp.]